jgi:hypothetical protein
LVFTGKGSKIEIGRPSENLYIKQTSNPFYIEVPANFVIKLPFNSESHFFVGAGTLWAIGIAGKAKTDGTALGFSSHSRTASSFQMMILPHSARKKVQAWACLNVLIMD